MTADEQGRWLRLSRTSQAGQWLQLSEAEAVAKIQPDIAFALWKEDNHNDHMVASDVPFVAVDQIH